MSKTSFKTISYNSSTKVLTINGVDYTLASTASGTSVSCGSFGEISLTSAGVLTINGTEITLPVSLPENIILDTNGNIIKASDGYLITSVLAAPTISLYDSDSALKIESANDEEDEYEIYVDDTLIGTYNKFYDFDVDGATIIRCLGKEYYTGEIVTPTTVNGTAITTLSVDSFAGCVASKIIISEGITSTASILSTTSSTVNFSLPSTIPNFNLLKNYHETIINIGTPGYIEYNWINELPLQSSNIMNLSAAMNTGLTQVNFYIKETITVLNNYSLYFYIVALSSSSSTLTMNYYFNENENEIMTIGTNLIYTGVSKFTMVYNIYTDNASIKDAMLTYAGQYCTVNVYKRNGGSW